VNVKQGLFNIGPEFILVLSFYARWVNSMALATTKEVQSRFIMNTIKIDNVKKINKIKQ